MTAAKRQVLARFVERLKQVRHAAGKPSLNQLVELTASMERPLPRSTISDKLNARSLPEWDFVVSFVSACKAYAEKSGSPLERDLVDLAQWDAAHLQMLRAVDEAEADDRLMSAAAAELSRRASRVVPTAEPPPAPAVPRQLPTAVRHFVGRATELAVLAGLADEAAATGSGVVIATIGGTAGVGKTTLAVHWAHSVASRFIDGQLYVNMRGFDAIDSPMDPAEAMRAFLDALGVPPDRIPATLDAKVGLYRSLMTNRRILVLLDNARDADQVRPLLPGSPGCLVLVTSRNRLGSLVAAEDAEPLTLDLLTPAEAEQLLAHRLGAQRIATDPSAATEIISRCARLPLALAIFAARAAAHPTFPLAELASELRQTDRELDGLDHGETAANIRTVFSWSYQQLSKSAAGLFRLLCLHPGPIIGVAAAASLAGEPIGAVRAALGELTRAHMIAEPAPGRYTFHDLLRAYATELAHHLDADTELHAATARLLDHYLHSAYAANRLVNRHRDQIALSPPRPGVRIDDLTDHQQALSWFDTEHAALVATVRHVDDPLLDTHVCQLVWTLADYLDWQGHWRDLLDTQRVALSAARRLSDRPEQARAERSLGSAYTRMGSYHEARTHLENAIELYRSLDDSIGGAHAHLHFTSMLERQGRHADALHHAQQSLELARKTGHPKWCARGLNAVGWYHALLGEYRQALHHCQQALALQNEMGDRDGAADSWDSLGYAHGHLGNHQLAVACYQHAIDLWKETGNRQGQADSLVNLGDTFLGMSRPDSARETWLQALAILDELDLADAAESVRANLHRLEPAAEGQANDRERAGVDR